MPRLLHYSDIENVYDDPDRVSRLAGLIATLDGDDTLVTGTGDNTAPGVLSLVERGRQSLDFFRAVGTDLETFGNHDFDYGPDATRALVADSPQEWVSANVRDEDGERFGAQQGVVPWTIREVAGDRIGFVGLTDPTTQSLNPEAVDLGFDDPVPAARRAIGRLREEGVDFLVALSHLGQGDDDLAALDFDAILGGHVHSERSEVVTGTLLTRPGQNGHVLLEVDLDPDEGDTPSVRRHAVADLGDPEADDPRVASGSPLRSLADALRGRVADAGLNETVAEAPEPLDRAQETVVAGECRIGNFVADAYRWAAGTDTALQNSGGLRSGPPLAGAVTMADLISVLPFEERIVIAEVSGTDLRAILAEISGSVVDFGEPGWRHGHVSGVEVVWDPDGESVREVTVGGEPLDEERYYTLATPEYLLHSDHEFPTLDEHHRAGESGIQHEVVADYAREFGVTAEIDGRMRVADGAVDAVTADPADSE
ncbi:bifunctional metallophosphatase/5'-nucleotidase [Salinirubrum litoreum]|uniref:Bifunctional metallophosphatase/5'-nucleotidase n=1 Tax=Salinirubrum litoreum TaxID=1126234 RepID=A0ABD5R8E4_9EURY|nr:bifunctional metallophosphatase/5'-nucleotidase [Salinirubrum litoreum]